MLTRPTVLVLGAGASQPFGLKLGSDLSHNIIMHLQPDNEMWRALVEHGKFTEDAISNFRHRFQSSGMYSIDAFLEGKDETTVRIGKFALAYELIGDENPDKVFRLQSNWLRDMYSQLDTKFDSFSKNRLSIITYNYD